MQEMYSDVKVSLDNMGRIEAMEWHWNGFPLLDLAPVRFSRALNGWISGSITPVAVPFSK